MVFTERQKNELKTLTTDIVRDIVNSAIGDQKFISTLVDKISDQITKRINNTLQKISIKVDNLESKIKDVENANEVLMTKLDNLEQKSKLYQLRIHGLPEKKTKENTTETLNEQVVAMFKTKLGITNVVPTNSYRIGQFNKNKDRNVVVTFNSIQQRNSVFQNKKKLKGSKMFIVEELTKTRHEILVLAKEKFGKNAVWTNDGRVYANLNNKKIWLKNEKDIAKIAV